MKPSRLFILVLLAVLLPLRGAIAAVMLCAGTVPMSMSTMPEPVVEAHATVHDCHGMATAQVDIEQPTTDAAGDDAPSASCPLCASGCCVTPLAFAPPALPPALSTGAAPCSQLATPASDHCPDGADRPPRSR